MLIFLRVVGVACFPLSMAARFEKFPRSISRRPSSIRRSGTRESNRGEKRRNESRLRMLGVYICIYTGEIVRIDLEMRILRAECVLRGCSGGALVHTFPSSFSSIFPGSGSTPFFTLPRLPQIHPIFFEKRDAVQDPPSSSIIFLSHPFHRYRVRLNKFIRKIGNREQRFQYGGVPSYNRVVDVYSRSFLRFREFSYRFE